MFFPDDVLKLIAESNTYDETASEIAISLRPQLSSYMKRMLAEKRSAAWPPKRPEQQSPVAQPVTNLVRDM